MVFVALFFVLLSSYKKEFWEAIYERNNKIKNNQRKNAYEKDRCFKMSAYQ